MGLRACSPFAGGAKEPGKIGPGGDDGRGGGGCPGEGEAWRKKKKGETPLESLPSLLTEENRLVVLPVAGQADRAGIVRDPQEGRVT